MKLYLIRHAESEANKNPEVYYQMLDWQIPITKEGKKQAKNCSYILKQKLPPYKNYLIITSPYVRAKQTSKIIKDTLVWFYPYENINCLEHPVIYERMWGALREEVDELDTREEKKYLFDFFRRPLNGESFADCYQRAFMFFEYLKNNFKREDKQNIIIVSHGEFLKLLLMIIDGKKVEEFDSLPNIKNCEIIEREINE